MSPQSRNIVILSPNWLGDAVMSLPLVGLIGAAAGVRLVVAAKSYTARVYCGIGQVAELFVPPAGGRLRLALAHRRLFREIGVEGVVLLAPSFSSALGPYLARVGVRVGLRSDGRGPLLTRALSDEGLRNQHLSENYVRLGSALLRELHVPEPNEFETPQLRVFAGERKSLDPLLDSAGVRPGEYAVVVPGATYGPTKSWPADKYRALIAELSNEIPVVVGGSSAERQLCTSIVQGIPRVHNFAGWTGLGEFIALLDGARVVVANDSGAPHVAASLGTPVVVIFGSTSPTWTAPLGETVHVIRKTVHCSPCFLAECPTKLECYEGITPAEVLEAARTALKKSVEKINSD
ncbi:MAG: lipopolysaccharide heptosyltransferase II [Candidatus Latescibacterota bacterium]|nr:MAG: lipopolysaccharide heptosyltransferase II [Candidatus Latescibacterota bacterium]